MSALVAWVHDAEISPTEAERELILEFGKELNLPPKELYFWPSVSTAPSPKLMQVPTRRSYLSSVRAC